MNLVPAHFDEQFEALEDLPWELLRNLTGIQTGSYTIRDAFDDLGIKLDELRDPWGGLYELQSEMSYDRFGPRYEFEVISQGPDRLAATDDDVVVRLRSEALHWAIRRSVNFHLRYLYMKRATFVQTEQQLAEVLDLYGVEPQHLRDLAGHDGPLEWHCEGMNCVLYIVAGDEPERGFSVGWVRWASPRQESLSEAIEELFSQNPGGFDTSEAFEAALAELSGEPARWRDPWGRPLYLAYDRGVAGTLTDDDPQLLVLLASRGPDTVPDTRDDVLVTTVELASDRIRQPRLASRRPSLHIEVEDAGEHEPVADVEVQLQSDLYSAVCTTDSLGQCLLIGLPASSYWVSFHHENYDESGEYSCQVSRIGTAELKATLSKRSDPDRESNEP